MTRYWKKGDGKRDHGLRKERVEEGSGIGKREQGRWIRNWENRGGNRKEGLVKWMKGVNIGIGKTEEGS